MNRDTARWLVGPALIAAATALGCTGEQAAGSGDLSIAVSGGAAVRDGFPHQEGTTTFAFADGWSLQFSRYVVTVGNLKLTEPESGAVTGEWKQLAAMDVKKGSGGSVELAMLTGLEAVRHDFAFDFKPASGGASNLNVDAESFTLMQDSGWSMLAEGTATHPQKGTVSFRLGLPLDASYYACVNGKDKTQGISIEANKVTGAFIYAHAMHMFWDTLSTGDEDLRFDAFAAMKGDDDQVTEEELKGQDLNDLRDGDGQPLKDEQGKALYYNDDGRLPPGKQTLYHFVLEAARGSAHFNGVGLCKQQSSAGQ